ncbi:MAG: NAD(P)H-dependent flavin oxidoreductase [Pseudomonadales bacterium]
MTELLGIEIPLIQAPMAGVSTPELAAVVANAGGLGSVAIGTLSVTAAERALSEARLLTDRPIAANVFVHDAPARNRSEEADFLDSLSPLFARFGAQPPGSLSEIYRSFNDDDEMLAVLLRCRPRAVSFHFGVPAAAKVEALKAAGILLLATATNVKEARLLATDGIDIIVAQGSAAGGHSGAFLEIDHLRRNNRAVHQETLPLVTEIVAELPNPVVAAGGLMFGSDIHAALDAGASGAQLGTAFVACPETLASATYIQWLGRGVATRTTDRISGRPARGLVNPLMETLADLTGPLADYPLTYDATKQLIDAASDPAFSVMWAGTGASIVDAERRTLPAAALVERLAEELRAASA